MRRTGVAVLLAVLLGAAQEGRQSITIQGTIEGLVPRLGVGAQYVVIDPTPGATPRVLILIVNGRQVYHLTTLPAAPVPGPGPAPDPGPAPGPAPGPVPDPPAPQPPQPAPVVGRLFVWVIWDSDAPDPAVAALRTSPTLRQTLEAADCQVTVLDKKHPWVTSKNLAPYMAAAGGPPFLLVTDGPGKVLYQGKLPKTEAEIIGVITKIRGG